MRFISNSADASGGGAIVSTGTLTIRTSVFSGNSAAADGGGGALYVSGGSAEAGRQPS
jgi:predicted outer membrane repeat protein